MEVLNLEVKMDLKEILIKQGELAKMQQGACIGMLEFQKINSPELVLSWLNNHNYTQVEASNDNYLFYSNGEHCYAELFRKWSRFLPAETRRVFADLKQNGMSFPEAIQKADSMNQEAENIREKSVVYVTGAMLLGVGSIIGTSFGLGYVLDSIPVGIDAGMLTGILNVPIFKRIFKYLDKKNDEADQLDKPANALFKKFNAVYDDEALEKLVEVCEKE